MTEDLREICEKIRVCKQCRLWKNRKRAVPGEGPADASLLFIGEAPGRKEDETGRPFVGRSGEFLDQLIKLSGLDRQNVFITSVIKCRPPNNRTPMPDELDTCIHAWMWNQIALIDPDLIVLLGRVAMKSMVGKDNMSVYHGRTLEQGGRRFYLTYHPAAGIRFPSIRSRLIEDFKRIPLEQRSS
jgi:uracil-DNA glycosylase family 4